MFLDSKIVIAAVTTANLYTGAPSSFRLIRSCGGEIVYEVKLPIRHNRLTALKFSYVNSNGEVMPRRGKPAEVEFIDTDTIFYREDRSALPFSNYRVRIALNIPSGSQIKEGPSFTSPQTISKLYFGSTCILEIITTHLLFCRCK